MEKEKEGETNLGEKKGWGSQRKGEDVMEEGQEERRGRRECGRGGDC